MRILRTYFSVVLLAVICFSITPKEFIHDLYDHSDTIENDYCLKGILHVEVVHHHCEMLNYAAFPFDGTIENAPLNNLWVAVSQPLIIDYAFVKLDRFNLSPLRGPPIA
jgi:hypothetical protein